MIGDSMLHGTKSFFVGNYGQLVVAFGVEDLIMVTKKDAFLVDYQDRVHVVKVATGQIKLVFRSNWEVHQEAYRIVVRACAIQ